MLAEQTLEDKFWSQVERTEDCWIWTGETNRGYGVCYPHGPRPQKAHRIAYALTYGDFDPKLFVCHRCDNPSCVRPDHLFLGTATENNADRAAKGRTTHPQPGVYFAPRLSFAIAEQIRIEHKRDGVTTRQLAKKYGCSLSTIYDIVRDRAWRRESTFETAPGR
jgi:hypothetical protein